MENTTQLANVKKGDLIEIVSPFIEGENYLGIVTDYDHDHIHVYHSDIRKTIVWKRRVKCIVSSL